MGIRTKAPPICQQTSAVLFRGSQACLERDVHQWVGSTDPIPITMYVTRLKHIYIYIWIYTYIYIYISIYIYIYVYTWRERERG